MGGTRAEIDLAGLMVKRQQVIGSTLRVAPGRGEGSHRRRPSCSASAPRSRPAASSPVLDRVLPLDQAGEAHRIMKASEHFGKIGLRVEWLKADG